MRRLAASTGTLGDIIFGSPSKSNEQSSSSQLQLGGNVATSFGTQGATSTSTSSGASSTTQGLAFEDLFKQLYGGAGAAAAGVDTGAIAGAAKQLFSGGVDFLGQLQGGAGTDYLASRVTGPDEAANAELGALKTSLGDFFSEQLVPGITSEGVSTGTLGGSRDAIARAQAAKAVAGQFSQGAAQILSGSQAQRDQAATQLAGIQGQNAATGLSALSSLYGLAQGGAYAGLSPYEALAQIMGGPTVLSTSQSNEISQALSDSFGQQGSQSYGFNFGTGSSESTGSSKGGTEGLAQAFLGGSGAGGIGKLF